MVFPNNILWQSVVFDRGMIVAAALPFKTPPTPWGNFAGQREEPQGLCSKEQGGKESWQESLFPKPFDYVTRSVEQEGNNHCNSKRLAWIQTVLKSTTEKGGREETLKGACCWRDEGGGWNKYFKNRSDGGVNCVLPLGIAWFSIDHFYPLESCWHFYRPSVQHLLVVSLHICGKRSAACVYSACCCCFWNGGRQPLSVE